MTIGCVFTDVCQSTLAEGRGDLPHPRSGRGGGGTHSQARMVVPHSQVWTGWGEGYHLPRSERRVPLIPGLDEGLPPSQVWEPWVTPHPSQVQGQDGGYPRVPPCPGLDVGAPYQDWMGFPLSRTGCGYPPIQDWMGYPRPCPPPSEQHSEHLLRGGRYAFCVHAGRLSCFSSFWYSDYIHS